MVLVRHRTQQSPSRVLGQQVGAAEAPDGAPSALHLAMVVGGCAGRLLVRS